MDKMRQVFKMMTLIGLLCFLFALFGCGDRLTGKTSQGASENTSVEKKRGGPLYVVLTVDVEDNRGSKPNLIEGDLTKFGIVENCGINYIMDSFAKYNAKGVFFVNVYEEGLYDSRYMPSLLQRVHLRGHEVGLHAHAPSSRNLPFYTKPITSYDRRGQCRIVEWGMDYIKRALQVTPVSYRSGAYSCNDDTFLALNDAGIKLDSSYFYGHKNCKDVTWDIQNQVVKLDNVIEVPIVVVNKKGRLKKLDLDWLSESEILHALEKLKKEEGFNIVQIMFHSFSMMDLKGDAENRSVKIADGNKNIYGENKKNKEKLNKLLAFLSKSPEYKIITFREYLKMDLPLLETRTDSIIQLF